MDKQTTRLQAALPAALVVGGFRKSQMDIECPHESSLVQLFTTIQEANSRIEAADAMMSFRTNCKDCPNHSCPGFMELLFRMAQSHELKQLDRASAMPSLIFSFQHPLVRFSDGE